MSVVLVEPAGTINLGSVARLCANFGVTELRLVAPRCDPSDPEAIRMAVRGKHLLKKAKHFSSLIDAIADCRRVIATCGRIDHGEIPLHHPDTALPWLLESPLEKPVALVFGREDRGLSNQELLLAQRVITIQTDPIYPSLNLSHSVGIILHELHRHKSKDDSSNRKGPQSLDPALPLELENCLDDAEELLLEVGFLLKHTSQARMTKVKGLLQRAAVRSEEVALIRGMLRQIRWAIEAHNS